MLALTPLTSVPIEGGEGAEERPCEDRSSGQSDVAMSPRTWSHQKLKRLSSSPGAFTGAVPADSSISDSWPGGP